MIQVPERKIRELRLKRQSVSPILTAAVIGTAKADIPKRFRRPEKSRVGLGAKGFSGLGQGNSLGGFRNPDISQVVLRCPLTFTLART